MNIKEIKAKQLELLDQITALRVKHSNYCDGCDTCNQVRELGKSYEQLTIEIRKIKNPSYQKAKQIIAKGKKASLPDIKFLVEEIRMSKKDVASVLRIPETQLLKVCRDHEIGIRLRKKAMG